MARSDDRARLLHDLDAIDADVDPSADGSSQVDALASRLLRTHEVAVLFQVSERAVTDWAARGRLPSVRTPGGHRRYPAHAVLELLRDVGLR